MSSGKPASTKTTETTQHHAELCARAVFFSQCTVAGRTGSNEHQQRTLLRQPRLEAAIKETYGNTRDLEDYIMSELKSAELNYVERMAQPSEQHHRREAMLKQYQTWNGIDMKRMDLPALQGPPLHPKVCRRWHNGRSDAWVIENQAIRQMSDLSRKGPHGAIQVPSQVASPVMQKVERASTESLRKDSINEWQTLHSTNFILPSWNVAHNSSPLESILRKELTVDKKTCFPMAERCRSGQDVGESPTAIRLKAVRFSDDLVSYAPSNCPERRPRSRAMTSILLQQRISAVDSKLAYIERLRTLNGKEFLQRTDKMIEQLKKTKPFKNQSINVQVSLNHGLQ